MAHVHYKFSSKLKYDTMVFDGLHITLRDLKRQIMDREKLRAGDCDLQITNAQTKEEYKDEEDLIAKNSSVIVRRIPMGSVKSSGSKTSKTTHRSDHPFHHQAFGVSKAMDNQSVSRSLALLSQTCNLANADVSEEDKIQAMMSQSNHEYDPINYVKKHGAPPLNYTCFRCGMNGHHIRNCPTNGEKTFDSLPNIKKSTGIPRSFMVEVDDPTIKGAMLTNCGRYAIPTIDAEAYAKGKKERPPFVPQPHQAGGSGGGEEGEEAEAVPTELLCPICRETLHDAVLIPCCGNSYCDDCIRSALLESDEHVCPTCDKADVSPDTLVANKFLRQAVNSFKNEMGHKKSQTTKGSGTPVSQTPNPSPGPNPPPLASTQTRPQRPYQPTRHQQDPLVSHPPTSHTPPSVQPSATSPVATGASSAHSTPVNSPQRQQNHPDHTPGSKEAEAEVSIDAADPSIPSVSPSSEEGPTAPPALMPPGYHGPGAEDLESTSPKNAPMSPSYPTVGHLEQTPVKKSSSTSSGLATGGAWSYPMEDPRPSLPPSHRSSGSSPILATPAASLLPPPPHRHFHPPPSLYPSQPFPPYPGYPPGYPFSAPPWAPPSLPSVSPAVPPPTLPSTSIPPLIPEEEMYRHKKRMKERSSSSRGANRDGQSQQRQKSTLDEMGSDFAKELLEYRRFQKQRRRSYSRSPQRSSSISQMSSDSYSKSYSSRSRSYSSSPSRSRSRSRSRGRSRSRSRSRSRPRHRRHSARRHANRSHYHGYKRSHSPTPPSSSPSRRMRSSRSRSWSRSPSRGSRQKTGGSHRRRSCHGHPGKQSSSAIGHYQQYAGCDAERYRQWEREYMEWYEKYFGSYTGKPHHLQPPPLLPTPRHARGPPVSGSTHRPYSSSSSSKYGESHPGWASTRRSRTPPRPSPNHSPSPASDDQTGLLTYQQRCSVMYGRQASDREEPEMAGLGKERPKPTPEHPTNLKDQNHKKKKRRRNERDRVEIGEAGESPSLGASHSSNRSHREGRSTPGHDAAVCSESDPGGDAWDHPYVGTQRGDAGSCTEPSRAREVGRPKDTDPHPAHGDKDRDSVAEKKRRREEEKNSKSPRTELSLDSRPESENLKSRRDGEEPRHGTKKRKPKSGEREPGSRGSLTESSLWEGATKVKKPQRKTISININLGDQVDEARKGGESDRAAGSLVEEDKVEATVEKGGEEHVEDGGGTQKQTTIPKATEEVNWGGEGMKTMQMKSISREDGGVLMEEEEWMAGVKKRQGGEEPWEQMAERSKASGRRSKALAPVHTRREGSEGRQERKMALKTLERYSSQDGFLLPEDKLLLMQVPRSRWEPLGEEEDEESGGKEESTSTEAQSASAAAVGAVSVSVPTKRAAVRDGAAPEDGARVPRRRETEGERGRTGETARKKHREAQGGHVPASPFGKKPSEAPERRPSPADTEREHKPGGAGRGARRTRDGEGGKDQRGRRAADKDGKPEELEGRAKESDRANDGTTGAAADGRKRGPSSSRASSSSRTAGDKRARDPEEGGKRKRQHECGATGNSQSSSSRSSSSSSSSFSQPDVYPQHAAAGSVDGGGRRRAHDTQPHHNRNAYETLQETPLSTPQDRQDDAQVQKHHQHHPQHRRPHHQDHHHPHDHHHRDPLGPPVKLQAAPWPGGRRPPALSAGGERRDPRPPFRHGADPPAVGRPAPGKAAAEVDRGQDKPGSDVFFRGRDALPRPRKPIDIKIISGASLFQHADPEKKNRM